MLPLGALIDGEESVQDVLKKKGKTPQPDTLLTNDNPVHTLVLRVLFERIDGDSWRSWSSLRKTFVYGSSGFQQPTGLCRM